MRVGRDGREGCLRVGGGWEFNGPKTPTVKRLSLQEDSYCQASMTSAHGEQARFPREIPREIPS